MTYTIENARAYGELSNAVYADDGGTPPGWEIVIDSNKLVANDPTITFSDSFFGCLYRRETRNADKEIVAEYAIAYRGGEYTDMSDGLSSTQIMTDQIPNGII